MLNEQQQETLLKPINISRIAKRSGGGGKSLSYLESWDVKAHLIRIFGCGGWSWQVISADLAYEEKTEKNWSVGYKVIGRLWISELYCEYTEAAVGSAQLPQRGEAHDMAIKTAESDALKRAAINLGDQFGLSLYNNGSTQAVVRVTLDQGQVQKISSDEVSADENSWTNCPTNDSEGAGIWIESMKAALSSDEPIVELLIIKKSMATEDVMDNVYQGVTLAKWLDKAVASTSKTGETA